MATRYKHKRKTSIGAIVAADVLDGEIVLMVRSGEVAAYTKDDAGVLTPLSAVAGTTNQVLVNGGTAFVPGSVVLSLPQNIHTGATPQFERIGIGQAADANSPFVVAKDFVSSSATNYAAFYNIYRDAARFVIARANGTPGAETQVLNTQPIGNLNFRGWHSGGALSTGVAAILATAQQDFTSTAWGTSLTLQTTGNGNNFLTSTLFLSSNGNVVLGNQAALATTAVDGFAYLPTCAGTPTGTPTAYTGKAPAVIDTSGSKLWVYIGGAWKSATLA